MYQISPPHVDYSSSVRGQPKVAKIGIHCPTRIKIGIHCPTRIYRNQTAGWTVQVKFLLLVTELCRVAPAGDAARPFFWNVAAIGIVEKTCQPFGHPWGRFERSSPVFSLLGEAFLPAERFKDDCLDSGVGI